MLISVVIFFLSLQLSYVRMKAENVLAAALMHGMINTFYFNPGLFPETLRGEQLQLSRLVASALILGCIVVYDKYLAQQKVF